MEIRDYVEQQKAACYQRIYSLPKNQYGRIKSAYEGTAGKLQGRIEAYQQIIDYIDRGDARDA